MAPKRRDNKGRILRQGERQREDGRYEYRYKDIKGYTRSVYSWKLVETDKVPIGKKSGQSLRQLEKQVRRDVEDGLNSFSAQKTTLNAFFDSYIETKYELKQSTRTNYKYMYKKYSHLREMIESVTAQTYKNWELCLADGSDAEHKEVYEICKSYFDKDERIVYKKLEKNEGISGNTNECYKMATGNYIGLFDHDDILHPSVLYEYMKVICEENADYIYCDEATFKGNSINNMIT